MNRHEGVSCDSCLKGNFKGRRYKCLVCFDYDLCANCYERGQPTTRHTSDHPMQCILTRADFDLYYGGEVINNLEQAQSFTCPYCGKMGFTDFLLQEHVSTEHCENTYEVVCPVCASMSGGDPNMVTDDLASHLAVEHRSPHNQTQGGGSSRDLISFLDEPGLITPSFSDYAARALAPPPMLTRTGESSSTFSRHGGVRRTATHGPRISSMNSSRGRRSNIHFSTGGLSSLSPSARETVDPIAELLSQLSGVRRSTGPMSVSSSTPSNPSQLQQLQMQLQLERQQVQVARQQLERFPRRHTGLSSNNLGTTGTSTGNNANNSNLPSNVTFGGVTIGGGNSCVSGATGTASNYFPPKDLAMMVVEMPAPVRHPTYQFLLSNLNDEELSQEEQEKNNKFREDRAEFVKELILQLGNISIDDQMVLKRNETQRSSSHNKPDETNKVKETSSSISNNQKSEQPKKVDTKKSGGKWRNLKEGKA